MITSMGTPLSRATLANIMRGCLHALAEQMLTLHRRLSTAKTPQEKTALERQIAATDT
jgi:hypothetical protein